MPFTNSPPPRTGPRRRSLLATAAGTALLVGCSGGGAGSDDERPSAERRARARASLDSRRLAAHYDAVIAAHPGLTGRLRELRTETLQHADAFDAGPSDDSASPSASASGGPSSTPEPPPVSGSPSAAASPGSGSFDVPADEKEALRTLAAAEQKLAGRRRKVLEDAPGERARLLASVAAAGDAHAYLLTEGDK
ncbi:hypothetical protein DSC45_33920 [Streptomyces sp. YIM 130001]|uniref:hypothetical protein n=1 Tax=Streptomyces sp. YIM 130001 TaxID=2259644 RepID=UPI000E64E575|nr:hypothetical protein [Streptomyces sp. YIM 130001]RII07997.1 hypothetical protein DSC45_33920 [Streptomyces sp. YIM 130001]